MSVSITIDSPQALLEMMNENALDIVYFLDKQLYDQRWVKVLEEPEEIVFAASSAHPFAGRKNLDLEEVAAQPFLLTEKAASYRSILDSYLASRQKKHPSLPGDRQHGLHSPDAPGQYGALPCCPSSPSRRTSSGERSPPWT